MAGLVDRGDLLRKVTGGDGGTGEFIWVHKNRAFSNGGLVQSAVGKPTSAWTTSGQPAHGAAPGGTARNPTNATPGALGQANPSNGRQKWLASAFFGGWAPSSLLVCMCDRLADISGLSGTSTSLQSFSGLSVTRYTGSAAAGNQILMEVYTLIGGTTARTLTVNYTNESGAASTTSVFPVGGPGAWNRNPANCALVPLAVGDRGVRSVESVQLDGSTGTAGDFGITIFRPLLYMSSCNGPGGGTTEPLCGPEPMVEILTGACLTFYLANTLTTQSQFDLGLQFVES